MDRKIIVYSPGKINLHLDIKARRSDGFHEIVSLFHKVDLKDEITIRSLKNTNTCSVYGDFDCDPKDNLIFRAAELYKSLSGTDSSFSFTVKKMIPAGAGLGGGSGNAAAVLASLNRMDGFPLSVTRLMDAGALLGSDVPFFLNGAASLVTGRGEKLEKLPPLKDMTVVLAVPDLHISTPEAYRLFDNEGSIDNSLDVREVRLAYLEKEPSAWPFFNSFKDPLYRRYPVLERAEQVLKGSGSVFCSLSGSGSAVFGLFYCRKNAHKALIQLKKDFKRVWTIKLLALSETAY